MNQKITNLPALDVSGQSAQELSIAVIARLIETVRAETASKRVEQLVATHTPSPRVIQEPGPNSSTVL